MSLRNLALLGSAAVGAGAGAGAGYLQSRAIAAHTAPSPWYPISQVAAGATATGLTGAAAYGGAALAIGGGMAGSKAAVLAGVGLLGAGFGLVGGAVWGLAREHDARSSARSA